MVEVDVEVDPKEGEVQEEAEKVRKTFEIKLKCYSRKTKFRKQQKGRMKGNAQRGNQLAFGCSE